MPKLVLIQRDFHFVLRGVALLAAGLQLTLHRSEEMVHPVLAGLSGTLACGHAFQQLQGFIVVITGRLAKKKKKLPWNPFLLVFLQRQVVILGRLLIIYAEEKLHVGMGVWSRDGWLVSSLICAGLTLIGWSDHVIGVYRMAAF